MGYLLGDGPRGGCASASALLLAVLAAGCGTGGESLHSLNGGDSSSESFGPGPGGDASDQGPLNAHIEQNHGTVTFVPLACPGACADVEAVAAGGHPPYSFAWDDGPIGPERRLCPASTTRYNVTVTDTGTSGEVARAPASVRASVTADVLAACPDGGDAGASVDAGDAPWSGCETIEVGEAVPLPDAGQHCTGATPIIDSLFLPKPLLAGQMYSIQATFQIQGLTGPIPTFSLLPSPYPCVETQSFFEQPLTPSSPFSGTVNFPACVTAPADYPDYPDVLYVVFQPAFSSIPSMTFTLQVCAGCGAAE